MEQQFEIKVEPGRLSADGAMLHLTEKKICKGCGVELDFWGRLPKTYHSPYCPYQGQGYINEKEGNT